jgi:acyl-CoA reductase-like NAD-dependent aldehyde dehydrogenase
MSTSEVVKERVQNLPAAEGLSEERIAYLESLVCQARNAAAVFTQFSQEDVDRIVKAIVIAGLEQAQPLARLAIEETKLGVLEDKVIKNMVATEFTYDYIKDKRTVGIIREIPERNLIEMAEPIGVIFSLIPSRTLPRRCCSNASWPSRRGMPQSSALIQEHGVVAPRQ